MARTLTETLRAGLLAAGWARTGTPSGRECYTKMCAVGQRVDGAFVKTRDVQMWLWLGEAGSTRWAERNAFTESYPIGKAMKQRLLDKGTPKSGAALLADLDKELGL